MNYSINSCDDNTTTESIATKSQSSFVLNLKPFQAKGLTKSTGDSKNSEHPDTNILICSISLLRSINANYYYAKFSDQDDTTNKMLLFEGISQLEPGTKYILNKLAFEGKRLDRILLHCSYEAYNRKFIEENGHIKEDPHVDSNSHAFSSLDFYKKRIKEYLYGQESFVKSSPDGNKYIDFHGLLSDECMKELEDAKNNSYTMFDGARTLYFNEKKEWLLDYKIHGSSDYDENNAWICHVKENENPNNIDTLAEFYNYVERETNKGKVNIFLDAQGGQRSFFNMIYSLFSMFDSSKIEIQNVCATDFNPNKRLHRIRDVTEEYNLIRLTSAINAFSQFGRGDLLTDYFSKSTSKLNVYEQNFITAIQKISDSISISNPTGFTDGLKDMQNALKHLEQSSSNSYVTLLKNDIQLKYGSLLTNNGITPLEIIRWCTANKFTQQALAFIEDKMPEFILTSIMPTYISDDMSNPSNLRPVNSLSYAGNDQGVIKTLGGSNGTYYIAPASTVLYTTFKTVINNANEEFVKEFILQSVKKAYKDKLDNNDTCLQSKIGSFLTAMAEYNTDIMRELACIFICNKGVKLLRFIDSSCQKDGTTTLREKYFSREQNSEIYRHYTSWGKEVKIINATYEPTDDNLPTIFSNIVTGDAGKKINYFYQDFYKFVFGKEYSIAGINRNPEIGSIKLAFANFSDFHTQILKQPEAVDKLLKDFTSLLLSVDNIRNTTLSRSQSNLITAYCQFLDIPISNPGQQITERDIPDIYKHIFQQCNIFKKVVSAQCAHTYDVPKANAEYTDLVNRYSVSKSGIDRVLIEKYCNFRNHEDLIERNNGNFIPEYWDYRVLQDLRKEYKILHDYNFYSTIIGKTDNKSNDKVTLDIQLKNSINLSVNYYSSDKKDLDLYLRLQYALKKERNKSSHASDNSTRLPFPLIERMILDYIALSDKLLKNAKQL